MEHGLLGVWAWRKGEGRVGNGWEHIGRDRLKEIGRGDVDWLGGKTLVWENLR